MASMLKIFIVIILSGLYSCSIDHTHHTHKMEYKPIEYTEQYCSNCNGVGRVKLSTGERVLWGVVTFGGGFAFESMECDICRGTGVIKVRKLNN